MSTIFVANYERLIDTDASSQDKCDESFSGNTSLEARHVLVPPLAGFNLTMELFDEALTRRAKPRKRRPNTRVPRDEGVRRLRAIREAIIAGPIWPPID